MRVRGQIASTALIGIVLSGIWFGLGSGTLPPSGTRTVELPGRLQDRLTGAGTAVLVRTQDTDAAAMVYEVRAWNATHWPLKLDSAIITVERVTDLEAGTNITGKVEILGAHGHTSDGKAYFRIPVPGGTTLEPGQESPPVTVKVRAPNQAGDLAALFQVRRLAPEEPRGSSLTHQRRPPPPVS